MGSKAVAANELVDLFHGKEACSLEQGESADVHEDLRSKATKACAINGTSVVMLQGCSAATALTSAKGDRCSSARRHVVEHAAGCADPAKSKASELISGVRSIAADKTVQDSAASAASSAVAVGASGGATGLAAGGALGAVVGVVPAHLTFGLSIPIGAAIGGGAGLVCGTAVGWTVGAVDSGGATYGVRSKKEGMGKS